MYVTVRCYIKTHNLRSEPLYLHAAETQVDHGREAVRSKILKRGRCPICFCLLAPGAKTAGAVLRQFLVLLAEV